MLNLKRSDGPLKGALNHVSPKPSRKGSTAGEFVLFKPIFVNKCFRLRKGFRTIPYVRSGVLERKQYLNCPQRDQKSVYTCTHS